MPVRKALYLHEGSSGSIPLVDLYEADDSLVLEMDLPGIDPGEVLIKVYEDVLIVEGIRRDEREEREYRYLCMERSFESFRRIIKLPVPVKTFEGQASYDNGVIKVTFPKIREKVIKIRIGKEEDGCSRD